MTAMTEIPSLLNGHWVSGSTGDWLERRDPADTTTVTSRCPAMGEDDAKVAVDAAVAAAPAWSRRQPWERGEILRAAAATLRANADQVAADITLEAGLSHAEASGEATRAPEILDYYAAMDRAPLGEVVPDRRSDVRTTVRREPLGTVLAITPWNNPVLVLVRKLGPALVAGNTVVVKPAEYTPRATYRVTKALHDAGLPAGVVNVVTGEGPRVGPALATAGGVDGITFTGSTAVGKQLQRAVAGTPTRVQAEMGGKNALYIDQDADLDLALDAIMLAGFGQTGQRCTATSRVLVHDSRKDELVDALTARAGQLRVGAGADPGNEMGPLIDAGSVDRVLAAVEEARASGARLTTGGNRLTAAPYDLGHFMSPTVVVDPAPSSRCWTDEIFGPVVSVRSVSSLPQAIDTVNASRYGLTASIFTRDLDHAAAFSQQVLVGNVAVNMPTVGWDVNVPFGGMKDSGAHYKEQGQEGLAFYLRTKAEAFGLAGFRT